MTRAIAFACTILTVTGALMAGTMTAASAGSASCRHVSGPFTVKKAYMVTRSGKRFVPYGVNLTGVNPADYTGSVAKMEAEEDAAASSWCANVVRLGAIQDRLFTSASSVNHPYLRALYQVVSHAESDRLAVVLTLSRAGHVSYPLPTWLAMRAWQILARRYRADPQVIFDIWNEPRVFKWGFWRNGGVRSGVRYYGMERLAQWIRRNGAHNMLWAEGRYTAGSLWGLPPWHLKGVGPVAYVIHHPSAPHDAASWRKAFGYLVGRYPVADDEWTNYSRSNAGWACWSDGLKTVPEFLTWLADRHIGMIAFNLTAPRLVESRDLSDPTYMHKDWSCTTGLNQGAGHRIMSWFRIHNGWF